LPMFQLCANSAAPLTRDGGGVAEEQAIDLCNAQGAKRGDDDAVFKIGQRG